MAFTSWGAFFAMGGYAFYVWLAVTITCVSLTGLLVHTVWQHKQFLALMRRRHKVREIHRCQSQAATISRHPPMLSDGPRKKTE